MSKRKKRPCKNPLIVADLIERINSGDFDEGGFPAREELCETYHVAPMTVRRAIKKLELAGYLICGRGHRAKVSFELSALTLKTERRGMTIGLVCPSTPQETFWLPELLPRLKMLIHRSGNAALEIHGTEMMDAATLSCDGYIILGIRETSDALYWNFATPQQIFCGCGFSSSSNQDVCLSIFSYMNDLFMYLARQNARHLTMFTCHPSRLPLLHTKENEVLKRLSRDCCFPMTMDVREQPESTGAALFSEAQAEIKRCGASPQHPCAVLFTSPVYARAFWTMATASGLAEDGSILLIGYQPSLKPDEVIEFPVIDFDLDNFSRRCLHALLKRLNQQGEDKFMIHSPRFVSSVRTPALDSIRKP